MKIEHEGYLLLFVYVGYVRLDSLYFRKILEIAPVEVAVEVLSKHSCPVVA